MTLLLMTTYWYVHCILSIAVGYRAFATATRADQAASDVRRTMGLELGQQSAQGGSLANEASLTIRSCEKGEVTVNKMRYGIMWSMLNFLPETIISVLRKHFFQSCRGDITAQSCRITLLGDCKSA